jgi:hypothetical protein
MASVSFPLRTLEDLSSRFKASCTLTVRLSSLLVVTLELILPPEKQKKPKEPLPLPTLLSAFVADSFPINP